MTDGELYLRLGVPDGLQNNGTRPSHPLPALHWPLWRGHRSRNPQQWRWHEAPRGIWWQFATIKLEAIVQPEKSTPDNAEL
jgi:hypothetical protein